ncbi:MAG: hypothetical protein ACK4QL_05785 [Pseudanabaenaceae cyanobacterium]
MTETQLPNTQVPKPLTAVGIWWRWFLAIVVGFGIGSVLAVPAGYIGLYFVGNWTVSVGLCQGGSGNLGCILRSALGMGALPIALSILLLQRLLMRRLIRRSWWWLVVSCLGWVLLVLSLSEFAHTPISGLVEVEEGGRVKLNIAEYWGVFLQGLGGVLLAGLVLAGLQWLLMLRDLPHSLWWVVLHGGLVIITAIAMLLILRGTGGLLALWLAFAVFLPIYGAITGATLAKIATGRR